MKQAYVLSLMLRFDHGGFTADGRGALRAYRQGSSRARHPPHQWRPGIAYALRQGKTVDSQPWQAQAGGPADQLCEPVTIQSRQRMRKEASHGL